MIGQFFSWYKQIFSWYILLVVLGWLTFPLTFRLFRKVADRGYAVSRILGLLLWGFGFWLLASLGLLQNQPGAILLVLALLVGVSVWSGWGKWAEILAWIKEHWRLILVTELVFLAAFWFMVVVRGANPAASGTEKPMELAFINAILHSKTFPPHDPWLSGYAISYYHFGYIIAALMAKVTGTSGGAAFNLMLSAVFALSAVGAYGVLYDLLAVRKKTDKGFKSALGWALLGPVFLLLVGNFEVVLEMLHQMGVGWDMTTGTSSFWQWINIEALLNRPSVPPTPIPQRFWWWWQSSRVVQDIDLLGVVSPLSPIDEFPAFSYVLGDLHPHVLVMPFVMLLVNLAFNIFRGGMDEEKPARILGISIPFKWDLFFISVILVGGIIFMNTWDLPVYFSLLVGAFLLRQVTQKGWTFERITEALTLAIPLGVLSFVFYLPFLISFQSQAGGILPNVYYPTRGLYLWVMFGTLMIPIFLFFGRLWRDRAKADWKWSSILVGGLLAALVLINLAGALVISRLDLGQQLIAGQGQTSVWGLLLAALSHRLAYGVSLVTLVALMVIGLAYLIGSLQSKAEGEAQGGHGPAGFVLLMVVLGGLMVLAPEFVYLRDNFGTRMNTVFKFYYQAWMLWSLAAAYASVVLLRKGSWLARIVIVVVLVMGLAFSVLAYPDKTDNFSFGTGFTLDAAAYWGDYQPDEAAAIDWLSAAEPGTVAEAVGGQYSSYARVATFSGQPTVLGWPGHEGQWRGGYAEVGSREADLRMLYEAADWETTLSIIRQYDIRYIFVGSLENSTYAVNPNKFEQNLELGFEQGAVRVYVVPQSLLE
jgi:YYY domain-containing protein